MSVEGAGDGLRMDMHVHTRVSFDSLNDPEAVLVTARAKGLDRVVVTDHNEIEGALRLHELDPERVLIGEEVKTREGFEVIGILLRERIPGGLSARETCERILDQDGVVYLPHPFDVRRSDGSPLLDDLAPWVDVVEAHNARCWTSGPDRRAREWAASHGKPLGAGSDAHTLREIGRGVVRVPRFEPRRESMIAALRDGWIEREVRSAPWYHLTSTYARLHKRVLGGGGDIQRTGGEA